MSPKTRTHCLKGHEYNRLNTRYNVYETKDGKVKLQKICRICDSVRVKRLRKVNKKGIRQ